MMAGHHHSHSFGSDVAASTNEGLRAIRLGVAGLLLTTVLQAAILMFTGSVALLADTAHNGVDVLATLVVGVAFVVSRRQPTRRFSFGFHRAEDLATLIVVGLIVFTAGFVAFESVRGLRQHENIEYPWAVLAAGVVGFLGNEAVAQYKVRVGRRLGSEALVADGYHSRADGFTSLAVVAAAVGALVGFVWIDSVVGLIIAAVIGGAAYDTGRTLLVRLLDGADLAIIDGLTQASREVAGIEHLNDLRVRHVGRTINVIACVCMPARLSLNEAHSLAEQLRHLWMHQLPPGSTVDIHVDPYTPGQPVPHPADEHGILASV